MPSLVVLILRKTYLADDICERWHDVGAPSITVFDCVGTRGLDEKAGREDLPLLPTIRSLLQSDEAPRKALLSIVPDAIVDVLVDQTEDILGDLQEHGNGILFAIPVGRVVGLRAPK